jgi:hypothetical protein
MTNYKLWLLVAQNANEQIEVGTWSELRIAEDTDVVPLGMPRLRELPGETVHADYKRLRSIVIGKLADELLQAVDRGPEILLKPVFSTSLIQSTVQWDVRTVGARRNAICFIREAIDVGDEARMCCAKHICVCGRCNEPSDLSYPMIDCDMSLEIGRIGDSERAALSIIKRLRNVVSFVHRQEKKAAPPSDRLIQRLGSVQTLILYSARPRMLADVLINVLGKHGRSNLF